MRALSSMSAAADDGASFARKDDIAAMLAEADALRAQQAAAMLGSAAISSDAVDDDEPDWVRARMEQEDRTFREKRDASRAARAAAWLDEERAIRAAEARQYGGANQGAHPKATQNTIGGSLEQGAAWGASRFDRAAAWMDEERAIRAAEAAAMLGDHGPSAEQPMTMAEPDHIAEYEARVRALSKPKTAEEKRAEYAQDQIRQIAEADAMDERLARKQRAARGDSDVGLGEEGKGLGPRSVDRGRGAGGPSDFR